MTPVLKLIEMLLSIAHEDRLKCFAALSSSEPPQPASSQLEHLICSLQTRLLAWCQQHLSADEDEDEGRRHGDHDAQDELHLVIQAMIVRCTHDNDHYDDGDNVPSILHYEQSKVLNIL